MGMTYITGLVLRPGRVEWTVLRESRKGREVVEQGREDWPPAEGADPFQTPEALAALRKAAAHARGEVGLGVESGKTLMRVVDLPSTDPAELAGMAELQVDKFSPFPVEQMAIAVEALVVSEKSTRALIATVQREIVERLGVVLRQAGLHVHRVDVEGLGWWRLLCEAGAVPEKGLKGFLLVESSGAELILAREGRPFLLRSLGAPGASMERFFEELVEETAYTLTSAESDLGGGGIMPLEIRLPRDRAGEPLVEALRAACAVTPTVVPLEDLPPLSEGLAQRGLDPAAQAFNLAPAEWGGEEQSRLIRRRLLAWSVGFLGVWAAVVSGGVLGLKIRRDRQAAMAAEVQGLEGPAAEVRALKEKVEAFERYTDRTFSALECLREVSTWLPEGIDLIGFDYRKGESLVLMGRTKAADSILDYVQALQRTALFPSAKIGAIRPVGTSDERKSEFTITIPLTGGTAAEEAP